MTKQEKSQQNKELFNLAVSLITAVVVWFFGIGFLFGFHFGAGSMWCAVIAFAITNFYLHYSDNKEV